jgi:SPP1 family predicted phage head-tail adaptor
MTPGKLNRRLTIERRTVSKDAVGGKVDTWATFRLVWAELVIQRGGTSIVTSADRVTHNTQWRIRHIEGFNEQDFRIVYQGRYYDINLIEPIGIKTEMLVSTTQTQAIPI